MNASKSKNALTIPSEFVIGHFVSLTDFFVDWELFTMNENFRASVDNSIGRTFQVDSYVVLCVFRVLFAGIGITN